MCRDKIFQNYYFSGILVFHLENANWFKLHDQEQTAKQSVFSQNRFSVIERLSTVSLSVFSLAPDLLFDCSSVVEYAKIRTVLVIIIIIIIASSNDRLMSAFEFSQLQISFCVVKQYFKIMEEHELKSKLSFRKKLGFKISHSLTLYS